MYQVQELYKNVQIATSAFYHAYFTFPLWILTITMKCFPTIYLPVTYWVLCSKMTLPFTTFPAHIRHICRYLLSRASFLASQTRRSNTTLPNTDYKWVARSATDHIWYARLTYDSSVAKALCCCGAITARYI